MLQPCAREARFFSRAERSHSINLDGEWSKSRIIEVQWQGIKGGGLDPFKDTKTEVILEPAEYRTGKVIEPYKDAQK